MVDIGIDVGGTFTDIVCLVDGQLDTTKVPPTKDAVSGIEQGIRRVLDMCPPGIDASTPAVPIHGTTVATNAILENTGAVTALIRRRDTRMRWRSVGRSGLRCTTSTPTPRPRCSSSRVACGSASTRRSTNAEHELQAHRGNGLHK